MRPDPNAFGRIPRDQEGGGPTDSSKEFPHVGKSYRWKDPNTVYKGSIRQIVGVVDKDTYRVRTGQDPGFIPMGKAVIDKIFSGGDRDREPVSDRPESKRVEYQSPVDDLYKEAMDMADKAFRRELSEGQAFEMGYRAEMNREAQSRISELENKVAWLEMELAKSTPPSIKSPTANPRHRKIRFD